MADDFDDLSDLDLEILFGELFLGVLLEVELAALPRGATAAVG
jgi:hypothetical protein